MSANNENIYIDLLLTNTIQTNNNDRVKVQFMLNQSQPILKNTDGYQMSIIRFSLNTETLPIFIPMMKNETETIYSLTMEYNEFIFQAYMNFIPQNENPIDNDEKYYIYSYQYVVYLVNQCFKDCYTGLNNLISLSGIDVPYMIFDTDTQKCSIKINSTDYGYDETNKINIYMNGAMYSLFSSLPASLINGTDGMDYQLNNLISQDNELLTQDYKTIQIWNPVSSIIFTSNLLPIYETTTPPIQIYTNGQISNNSTSYNFLNIMTDFIGNDLTFTPFIQYSPNIVRYISLKPKSLIRNIDLNVFWLNKNDGKLKPLYLIPGGSCSVKLFISKIINA